jgi:hypothetical protein
MADCPNMPSCRMFAVFKMANALEVWKLNYCKSAYQSCERFKMACNAETVPDLLLPNGKLLKRT